MRVSVRLCGEGPQSRNSRSGPRGSYDVGVHVTGQAVGRHLADGCLTLHRGARDQAVRAANRSASQLIQAAGPDAEVLQGEPQRVHHAVARHAGGRAGRR